MQPLFYQWQFNGTILAGATGTSFTLNAVQTTNGGNYAVVITNTLSARTSGVAVLTIVSPPAILSQPVSRTNAPGSAAAFAAGVSGTAPVTFQWRWNGAGLTNNARISGATLTNLVITGVQTGDAGNYSLLASNLAGTVASASARGKVSPPGNPRARRWRWRWPMART